MSSLLGIRLTLLIGPVVPLPAPLILSEALEEAKVTHADTGRSGFQLTFKTGRGGPLGALDYPALTLPQLRAFNRVILVVTFGFVPRVISDGIITRSELSPGDRPGQAKVTVTGEDVAVMLDMHEHSAEHPAQPEPVIAAKLMASYASLGIVPFVVPPVSVDVPIPIERTPVQQGTDLAYLEEMAKRHGYVFYVTPGPAPGMNVGYWGPPVREGFPQPAITVNMGAETNAKLGAFQTNALEPTTVTGKVQDRLSGQTLPVFTFGPLRTPLATQPAWLVNQPNVRSTEFRESGLSAIQAYARAQGTTEAAADAVTVDGELDAGRYGDILQARSLVGVRGAGYQHDGFWYVKRVSHEIKPGSYKQSFSLSREGHGSTTPVVRT
jgi:hypothetical protein